MAFTAGNTVEMVFPTPVGASTNNFFSLKMLRYAQQSAKALFAGGGDDSNMPTTKLTLDGEDISIIDVLVETKLCSSRGEAKKLIQQGGVSIEEQKITDLGLRLTKDELTSGVKIKKGKKIYHKVTI